MQEIRCRQCGEPYGVYSLRHEIPEWDNQPDNPYEAFTSGEGCPTCDWGEKAGEVSTSRTKSDDELEAEHLMDKLNNTDEDPLKFF